MARKRPNNKHNAKRPIKQGFTQSTAQWHKDIFVCTGFNEKEILRGIKRIGAKTWMLDFAERCQKDWKELVDANSAFVSRERVHSAFVMRLRDYEDTWDFWETLLHEISHLVDGMSEAQAFTGETEAKAYLQEYLFHEIRRKLQGVQPYGRRT